MKFWELVRIANRNLLRNKLRTILTILAIFIGAFTLVMTNGIADGLRDYIDQEVKSNEGENIIFVQKKFEREEEDVSPDGVNEYKEPGETTTANRFDRNSFFLDLPQIEATKNNIPEIVSITPNYRIQGEWISFDGAKKYHIGLAMLSEGVRQKVEAGQTTVAANQVIIPYNLAKSIDPDLSRLIGKTITVGYRIKETNEIKTIPLEVVGVATKGFMVNYSAFIDATTARLIYEDQNRFEEDFNKFTRFTIQLNTSNEEKINEVKQKLAEQGLEASSFADLDKRKYDGIGVLQIGLGFFAFIALLAASFGIINTLVVAVMERTKEIGLQKALGMGKGKIFMLFSLESILIGFWGGVLGVAVGIFVGKLTNFILATTYSASFEGYSLFSFHLTDFLGDAFSVRYCFSCRGSSGISSEPSKSY